MARYLLSLTFHIIVFTDLPHHDPYVAAILFDLKPSASLHVGRKRNSHAMAALVGSGMHPAVASIVGSFSPSIGAANVQPIPFDTPQMREARHMAVLTGMKRFDPSPVCASSHTSFCQAELPEGTSTTSISASCRRQRGCATFSLPHARRRATWHASHGCSSIPCRCGLPSQLVRSTPSTVS